MRQFLIYILLFIPILVGAQQKISFIEEYIDFELNKKSFEINGIYVFLNATNQKVQKNIIFPFGCINADLTVPFVRVYNLTKGKKVHFKFVDIGIFFKIEINPHDTMCINIAYNQKVKKENIYILNSTSFWGKPLKKAKYTLSVNDSIVIDSFSYQPDSINQNLYFWEKTDFMPEEDFKIRIKYN